MENLNILNEENVSYFTIESLENDNEISFTNIINYSLNNREWNTLDANEIITVNAGDVVRFKSNLEPAEGEGIGIFTVNKTYNVKGNVMSLLYGDDFENKNDLTGKDYVFKSLFSGSTTLVSAGELILPATTLSFGCYCDTFIGCSSLTVAPELPAITLEDYCYCGMFYGCKSLTVTPELNATKLSDGCYQHMFSGCTNLNTIIMLATNFNENDCLNNWINDVGNNGVFFKNPSLKDLSIIPNEWEVKNYGETYNHKKDFSKEYFTIESLEDNNNISFTNNILYSVNENTWNTLEHGNSIIANNGDMIKFKIVSNPITNIGMFSASKNYNVKGNIMSLVYGDDFKDKTDLNGKSYIFYGLFYNSTTLVNAANLILPATKLSFGCYRQMFANCTSLVTAPILSATTLSNYAYNKMFQNCKALNNIIMLATDINANNCLTNWVNGVGNNGNFYKKNSMTSLPIGNSGIPEGWEINDYN